MQTCKRERTVVIMVDKSLYLSVDVCDHIVNISVQQGKGQFKSNSLALSEGKLRSITDEAITQHRSHFLGCGTWTLTMATTTLGSNRFEILFNQLSNYTPAIILLHICVLSMLTLVKTQ